MIRVFIGYDSNETVAWHTLCHSILKHSTQPVSFIPIARDHIKHLYDKPKQGKERTEFRMTRFLVPYLSGYEGWSIFMDCDMIVTQDIAKLWELRDNKHAVMCTKHQYSPLTSKKFLNQDQTSYEKKNWSSVMLFNNEKCQALTPEVVATQTGMFLHQFRWLTNHHRDIGNIPLAWNFLVGEQHTLKNDMAPSLIHYTLGGPYFNDHKDVDYADVWFQYHKEMNHATQIKTEYEEEKAKKKLYGFEMPDKQLDGNMTL